MEDERLLPAEHQRLEPLEFTLPRVRAPRTRQVEKGPDRVKQSELGRRTVSHSEPEGKGSASSASGHKV